MNERYEERLEELLIEKEDNEDKLYWASMQGNVEEVKILLYDHKVDVNSVAGPNKYTPLILAARQGHHEIMRILINAEADIEGADKSGNTSLYWATWADQIISVKILLTASANPNNCNKVGQTPLHWSGSKQMAKLLIEHGADPNRADIKGKTPLHMEVDHDTPPDGDLIQALIEGGADPNTADNTGITPFHMAVNHPTATRKKELIRILIQGGADPDKRDISGKSLIIMLEEMGLDIDVLSK